MSSWPYRWNRKHHRWMSQCLCGAVSVTTALFAPPAGFVHECVIKVTPN